MGCGVDVSFAANAEIVGVVERGGARALEIQGRVVGGTGGRVQHVELVGGRGDVQGVVRGESQGSDG